MNSFEEPFENHSAESESFDQSELDRMVDGELSDEQQRSLLNRLERSSTGWKRLALAYVEASTFKTCFGAAPSPTVPIGLSSSSELPLSHLQTDPRRSLRHKSTTSAFAAIAVLAVFGLGVWLGRTQIEHPDQPVRIAEKDVSPLADTPEISRHDAPEESVDTAAEQDTLPTPETVQVVFSDGQSDVLRVVDVPISTTDSGTRQLDEFWNRSESAMPPALRAALEGSGHQIRETRDFWPAQLPDGRAVVIPVSQIHVANNPLLSP